MTTNAPTPPPYPDASARRLLGDHLGNESTYLAARIKAGKALIHQLEQLLRQYGVVTEPFMKGTGIAVHLRAAQVFVGVKEENGTVLLNNSVGSSDPKPVPLYFNPDTGLFEGKEVDKEVAPVPGQLRERRSALTTIVATIFGESPQG